MLGPVERHFAFEEHVLFPKLERHDLGPEVQVATKQHDALRQMAKDLATAEPAQIGELVFEIARLLLHHTNFEGDYIYPELTHDEWRELMKETVDTGASHAAPSAAAQPDAAAHAVKS